MKLSLFVAALAVLTSSTLHAQSRKNTSKPVDNADVNYKVTWGPELRMKGHSPGDILLYDENGFYTLTDNKGSASISGISFNTGGSYFLSKFNNKMDLVLQTQLEIQKSAKNISDQTFEDIFEFNHGIYIITREKDKKNKNILYFIEKVDLTTLQPDGNKIKLSETNYADNKLKEDAVIRWVFDRDKKVMMLYQYVDAVKKGDNVRVIIRGLDNAFTTAWKKEVSLPLADDPKDPYYFDRYVDPSSNMYLLATVYFSKEEKGKEKFKAVKNGLLNYDYHIYKIGKDIDTYIDYSFNLRDKDVSDIRMDMNNKGEVVACGFYGDINRDKNEVSGYKGVFFTLLDASSNAIKAQSYKKFDDEVLTDEASEKSAGKVKREHRREAVVEGKDATANYIIKDILPRKDGGSTMFAEENYTYSTVTRFNGRDRFDENYVYKNIIVTKINAAGEIEWTTVVRKKQLSTIIDAFCSYVKYDEGNDTYDLFFNDNQENLDEASLRENGIEWMYKIKEMRFVKVAIKPDGSLSKREQAFNMGADGEDTYVIPQISTRVNDKEVVLFGVEHRKEKFAKITFD